MRSLRVPALVAGISLISAAVAMGVVSSRTTQARADTQDGQLGVSARQAATALTQTFERVRTIDLMLAHTPVGLSASELRYNRAAYMPRRRELAERWAALIMADALPSEEIIDSPRRKPRS